MRYADASGRGCRRMQGEIMKFGIFMAPFHKVGENPALAFERDMRLIEWLDELGFDEAFIGEHHSAGWEIISSPEIFMAVAATRTKRIMLGSGVVSVPYHHPFNIANRFALLDQLTRGRVMLGCGPGALPGDAYMLGIETTTQRERMVEGVKAVQRLFTEDGGITIDGSYFKLRDAHLQVKPYQKPYMPIFVANTFSPSGMVAAGQLGCGVLSIGTFAPGGLKDLPKRWEMAEEIAAENGKTVDRANWRLVFPVHLADSKEEALNDIRLGANTWIQKYFIETLAANLQFEEYPGQPPTEFSIDRMVARGGIIVGTPDDAIQQIEEVQAATGRGGFGGLLILAHEWASREKTLRSYELWARYVAPHFQGIVDPIALSNQWTSQRKEMLMGTSITAIMKSISDYKEHREAAGQKPSELADRPLNRIRP
jgi:limonene 1,2-monooxygenase